MPSNMFLRSCRRRPRSRSRLTGSSFLPRNWGEIPSVITGLIASTLPCTCWTSVDTVSASALLSLTVVNTIRSGGLLSTDFRVPEAVLSSLNQAFQMDRHNDLYFTIWYGVYHRPSGRLRYASAGHPSPILVSGTKEQPGKAKPLSGVGFPVGLWPVAAYESKECTLAGPARLFLFSDGAFEITRPDGTLLEFEAFEEVLTRAVPEGASELEELLHFVQDVHGSESLDDDFSIIKMTIRMPEAEV